MASPTQLVQFTFAGGIDESIRVEALEPSTSVALAENVRANVQGEADKRLGFDVHVATTLSDSTVRTAGYRMFAHGKQTCIVDGGTLASFSPSNEDQISRGRVPECGLSMMKVPTPGVPGTLTCTDSLRVGEYLVLTYTAGNSVYAAIVEAETGQVISPPTLIYTGSAEIYGLLGKDSLGYAHIFILCFGETGIKWSYISMSDGAGILAGWSAATNVVNDNGGLVMAVQSFDRVALAYQNNTGGASRLSVVTLKQTGIVESTTVNTNSNDPGDVGLGGESGDTLWIAWNESTNCKVRGLSPTSLSTVLASTLTLISSASAPSLDGIAVVASSTAGAGRLFVNDGGGSILYARNFTTSSGAVTVSGGQVAMFSAQMSGRPFRVGSRYYGVCRGTESSQKVAVLCDLTEANPWVRPVANVAPGLASSFFTCQAAALSSREFWSPIGVQTAGSVVGVQMAKFNFDANARCRAVPHNGCTFLSGGLTACFTGDRVAESNFIIRPPQPTLSTNGAGSFTVTTGVRVVLVYEQVDAAGNWHVSGVSTPSASSGAFTNKVNLAVTCVPLGISARISAATDPSIRISAYVTADGGEPPYYYAGSVTNALTAATQTLNITSAGGGTALLYGTGALPNTGAGLQHGAPQGFEHLCSYNGMLVGALGEEIFWSSQDVDGEGIWWNDNFSMAVTGGGDITALEAAEGTLYAFKRDRIFAMAGDPPNDSGTIGGLGTAQRLASPIGATSPFTCVTELGIFFVNDERGVCLLNRGGGVEFIGEQVQTTFASCPHVSAMTYDPVSACVLIECSAGRSAGLPTGNGRTLVFDTRARTWRSFDRRTVSATADVPAADGCMVWDGSAWRYGWLHSNGVAYVEADHYLDPGDVWITKKVRTGYVKLGGIQGQQIMNRVLLLAKRRGDGDLKMAASYDYNTTFQTPSEWTSATLSSLSTSLGRVQVGQDLSDDSEGQAVAIEIYDEAPSGGVGDGAGQTWIALTFEGQPRDNAVQLSQEAR